MSLVELLTSEQCDISVSGASIDNYPFRCYPVFTDELIDSLVQRATKAFYINLYSQVLNTMSAIRWGGFPVVASSVKGLLPELCFRLVMVGLCAFPVLLSTR